MNNLIQRVRQFKNAKRPEEIFGECEAISLTELKGKYRAIAAEVHPDKNRLQPILAAKAFRLLQELYAEAKLKVKEGRYGQELVIQMVGYTGYNEPLSGDITDLYPAFDDQYRNRVMLKVSRWHTTNDLLEMERQRLTFLERQLAFDPLRPHFPTLIDSLIVAGQRGVELPVNVLKFEEKTASLREVMARFPNGIDPADMAWMFNRLLAALGKTHDLGLVHGAVLPEHLLIRPHDHNGILIDWCYSVEDGDYVKAISPANAHFYPPEVLAKAPAGPATDLYMAALTMLALLGGDVYQRQCPPSTPRPIVALLESCLLPAPHRRVQDAWELFDQFNEILGRLYGPPIFREFEM